MNVPLSMLKCRNILTKHPYLPSSYLHSPISSLSSSMNNRPTTANTTANHQQVKAQAKLEHNKTRNHPHLMIQTKTSSISSNLHRSSYSLRKHNSNGIIPSNRTPVPLQFSQQNTLLTSLSSDNNQRLPKQYISIWPALQQAQSKADALTYGRIYSPRPMSKPNSKTNPRLKLKVMHTCSYQLTNNDEYDQQMHPSFNLIRKFLTIHNGISGIPQHLKGIIQLKSIKFLMTNYAKNIITIIQSAIDNNPKLAFSYSMTKHQFSQFYQFYKEPHYKSFINDFFLIFNSANWTDYHHQQNAKTKPNPIIDIREAITILILLTSFSSYRDSIRSIMKLWFPKETKALITIGEVLKIFLLLQAIKGNSRKVIDVIKAGLETEQCCEEIIERLQGNSELKQIVDELKQGIDGVDMQFSHEIKKMSHRKMLHSQYELYRNVTQMHCCNEVKNVEGILASCLKLKISHDGMNQKTDNNSKNSLECNVNNNK